MLAALCILVAVLSMGTSLLEAQTPPLPPNAGASPPQASPVDNPFPEQRPSIYQSPDEQMLPLLPPGIPLAIPANGMPPPLAPTQPPPPATVSDLLFGDNRKTPEDHRSGAFQGLSFVNSYLPRRGTDGFGMYDVELKSIWGLPFPNMDSPLLITPDVANHWLNGPSGLDIPAQLHDISAAFRWLPKLGERFRADIAVQPGWFSDWDGSSVRSVRVMGHGAGIYDWSPDLQVVLGCAYLDRPDIELLPIAGLIWKPSEWVEYRLVFPYPKISYRLPYIASVDPAYPTSRTEHVWLYFAGELGGGTWAIRHSDGSSDLMSYSDVRVFMGLENRTIVGIGSQIEFGYVFHRYIRLTSTDTNFDLSDTLMVRAALNF